MASTSQPASSMKPELKSSPSGIPQAPFIEDVEQHLGGADADVTPTLQKFQETMQKYKIMEASTFQRSKSLQEKIPDIEKTLKMVEHLRDLREADQSLTTHFELHDTLYTQATVSPLTHVNLWLGANVMLSYPLDEARDLLQDKLATAKKSQEAAKKDLDFLRDQITVMEVNTARVHNWDVKRRRERRLKEGAEE
ncbi:Prefoldin, subunit 3 [Jaminaea rosea]|uniref:Prefoldin subunit 3 n=1 Tax=Jaminaea rosea TaxID=1569628 RepID=A0A316V4R5_9BASI|nr:Prefoldin, subunit 3 [Jaminaea rosea]PWN30435.1 Prefoldin, subunit 3 [Jaminaea rosea]